MRKENNGLSEERRFGKLTSSPPTFKRLTRSMLLENEGADPEKGCHDISKSEHRLLKRGKGRFDNSGRDHRTGVKPKDRPIQMAAETRRMSPESKAMIAR